MKRSYVSSGSAALPALVMTTLALAALAGCGKESGTAPAASKGTIQLANPGPAVETINGEEVPYPSD